MHRKKTNTYTHAHNLHTICTQYAHTQDTENDNMQHTEQNTEQHTEQHREQTQHSTENSAHNYRTYSLDYYYEFAYIKNSNTIEIYTISKENI